jgi:hypothetical protein
MGIMMAAATLAMAQDQTLRQRAESELRGYFMTYTAKNTDFLNQPRMKELVINDREKSVKVVTDEYFAQQEFTNKQVGKIYKSVKNRLPRPYNDYRISIVTNGMPIENYVVGHKLNDYEGHALWGNINYDDHPWVTNVSTPVNATNGLYDRHIALWASHGRYYDNNKGRWKWQRPNLFGTTEDLFTQTIVVPYLIPMLEKAGAVVFTPRERDWQKWEYVVDPDGGLNASGNNYKEYAEGDHWTSTGLPGFRAHTGDYVDGENPFTAGTARMIKTHKKDGKAYTLWQPNFIKEGRHAVYVSYQTLKNSIDDAHYIVFHKGQATEFRVNQRMGGGTWVYLGTFDFDKGDNLYNCVMLTNQSRKKGVVTADAVRFGGGMGNITRGGSVSGYPRSLEGARYYAQWAGAPYEVYGGRGGTDDYSDDINARSRMLNWLAGGSVYVPTLEGKQVPIELSLAVHSDAGFANDGKSLIGSLAICTTDYNDGRLSSGISRMASKLFADQLLSGVTRDMSFQYKDWARRYLWDKNYSETRLPEVPSAILETMSHQNFPDMLRGQDPNFKFAMARSIYKTIVRYVNGMHGKAAVITPLSPENLAVEFTDNGKARISWTPQEDEQEPTAKPTYYILYTATGTSDFDNGQKVNGTSTTVNIEPGVQYNFKVAAANRGGESFASEVVSAYMAPNAHKTILVVNGFHRLSAPAVIDDGSRQGFDLNSDIGVSYGTTAGWNGRQQVFTRSRMGVESETGLGYGGDELAGQFIAGNEFNYTVAHTQAIAASNAYNVVSCSSKALEIGSVNPSRYAALDLILGLEKYAPQALKFYKSFTTTLQRRLTDYTRQGGRLLVSGAYIGSDMTDAADSTWLSNTLKVDFSATVKTDTISGVRGLGLDFDFYRLPNEDHYAATHADVLGAQGEAICAMLYGNGAPAAVAYAGSDYKSFTMGFPFECITDPSKRASLMQGILTYILK